jgi:hypothetical protein
MAYFAELDENNLVIRVVAIADADCLDENGLETEQLGINRCLELFKSGTWKQTSFNTHAGVHLYGKNQFRKNYAGIGYTYDLVRDAFIAPKPEATREDWYIDEDQCIWRSPSLEAEMAANEIARQSIELGVTRV